MMLLMRTTLTLEDQLAKALKKEAFRTNRSFKEVVNTTLRAGLAAARGSVEPRGFRIEPVSLGGVRPGIDLDRTLALADALEDAEIRRELEQRK